MSQVLENLTNQETEILIMLASGSENKDIAKKTGYSLGYLRNTIAIIYQKLELPNGNSRVLAAKKAILNGLVNE